MNWLNLKTSQLREPAFIGSEPVARATWLCVLTYCVEQENGGRLTGARAWKDRQWQQTCGVMLAEVEAADPLLEWDGNDLLVWSYPADKETEVQTRRETAKNNGKRGGRPRNPTEEITHEKPTLVSKNNQRPKAEGERKEKEKGKEVELELVSSEPGDPASEPTKTVLKFPCVGGSREWSLSREKVNQWQETYPDMDVMAALRQARQWCEDNAAKRKTEQGMPRFLGTWLSTAQNKGHHRKAAEVPEDDFWIPTHPDALKSQEETLRETFIANHAGNPNASAIIERLKGSANV